MFEDDQKSSSIIPISPKYTLSALQFYKLVIAGNCFYIRDIVDLLASFYNTKNKVDLSIIDLIQIQLLSSKLFKNKYLIADKDSCFHLQL